MQALMKHKMTLLYATLAILVVVTGVVVYKVVAPSAEPAPVPEEEVVENLPEADASIVVDASFSKVKDNTVVLKVSALGSKYTTVGYELTYDSQGLIKGVNSGSKPVEVAGQDGFEREVYLGTCSRNVCKPDLGVTKVTIVMEFTDTAGKKSQFSKDFDL
ncbi:MAG: hypothetical protein ACOY3M_04790 [Patescibacteria group bacterium]